MHLQLDGKGPLHAQLTRALKGALTNGVLVQGKRLPATRQLAEELGLSRNTVLAAYEQLRSEGFVEARVGSGSFVTAPLALTQSVGPTYSPTGPQSAFSGRAREFHPATARFPGTSIKGTRYSFQYGLPIVNPALTTLWAKELARAAMYTSPNYANPQGLLSLREAICDYLLRRRGVRAHPQDVLIVSGTQQAIALSARVVFDPGDLVAIEDPNYLAVRRVLQVHGAKLEGVPVDDHGIRIDLLPSQPPRLICVTPSHQMPLGATLSHTRRMQLLRYAKDMHSWIFEDDYDGEFRYDAKPLPALRSLDSDGRVIYVGTFSKALFPALRLGYIVMPPALRQDFISAKWIEDFGCSSIEQAALAHFMTSGGYERHLSRSGKIAKDRRRTLLHELETKGDGRLEVIDSHAGMHLVAWLHGRTRADLDWLISRALDLGLGLHSIQPHYMEAPDRAGLLFGFCGLSSSQIREGVTLFAQCLDELDRRTY